MGGLEDSERESSATAGSSEPRDAPSRGAGGKRGKRGGGEAGELVLELRGGLKRRASLLRLGRPSHLRPRAREQGRTFAQSDTGPTGSVFDWISV